MTFSTKISSTVLPVSRQVVFFSREQPHGNNTTLTGSNLKEIFGPANKKKRQGLEKKVLDELAEAWESNQTIHKRRRLLLGPSFAEVNLKKKHNDHINSSFCNDCLISWYRSILSNSFLWFFICSLQNILGLKDKTKAMKNFRDDFIREKDNLVPLFLKKCQSEKLKIAKMVIAVSIQQNKNKHFKQNIIF